MGGRGGGSGFPSRDQRQLEREAKEKFRKQATGSPHAFLSFDHEDSREVDLLRGQAKNKGTDLEFDDYSLKEPINSSKADYVKRKIREKIKRCSTVLVYLTPKSARSRWVDWEIGEALRQGKKVVGVHKGSRPPSQLPPKIREHRCKVIPWDHGELAKVLENKN